jgi:DNA-binding MarR family transcriptional regulator
MESRLHTALDNYAPAFLGMFMSRLVDEVIDAGSATARAMAIDLPPRSMSLVTLLFAQEMSVTELAAAVGQTHAAVIKNMKPLEARGLVVRRDDSTDARRRPYGLTSDGRALADELERLLHAGAAAFRELFDETGIDLYDAVLRTEKALAGRSLTQRMLDHAQQDM